MMRVVCTLTSTALLWTGAWQQPVDPRAQVLALVDAGRLDEAERLARGRGPEFAATLGEVLALSGRLEEADSVFRVAIERDPSGRRTAEAALAELAYRRGNSDDAFRRAAALVVAYEQARGVWSSVDRVAAGRAYILLGARNAQDVRKALAAFDEAVLADSNNLDARLRLGDLFLDKYNAPDAKTSFDNVLRRAPGHPRALLGLARVAEFEGKSESMALVRRSLTANPSLVGAHVLLSKFHLEAEAYDSAKIAARRALAVNSASLEAWSLLGAAAWLTGDSMEYSLAKAMAQRLNARPSEFYVELAEAAVHQRRYVDGVRLARAALALDSMSTRALGILGTNQMRAGNFEDGRATLERAFAIDPFNLWHKNTLDLLDNLRSFRTIDRGRFRIVAPPKEAELLSMYLIPLLEEAFDSLATRYHYRPQPPVRIELYRQHADFSVRTVGLAGLGALGVSFGPVIALDAPSARQRGEFNWGSTAWHELTHTFTLGLSDNRVPRWLSEGLSVLEERRARQNWGADASIEFLAAFAGGRLQPLSGLNDGFVRPRFSEETIFSYYEASLACEMIEQQWNTAALVGMLTAYRDGLDTRGVLSRVLALTPEQLDRRFDAWVRTKFAVPLNAIRPGDGQGAIAGPFVDAIRAGLALTGDSARATLLRAQRLFPEYAGVGAPAWSLARLAHARGDLREALEQVVRITTRNEAAWDANVLEADLRAQLGDSAGAIVPLERLIWIWPYEISVHARLAALATRVGNHARAVRERRAVLALDPPDSLDARYQLARALADAGDVAEARRELLGVLEQVPTFEKAQALLLELRNGSPPGLEGRP